jgi:hypothetical protein
MKIYILLSAILLIFISLSIPCLAENVPGLNNRMLPRLNILREVGPVRTPDVKDVYGTREVEAEENTVRIGTGLKSMCVFYPESALSFYFNRDHGLEIGAGIFNIYSISYKRLLFHEEKRRQYLALGGMGHVNWQTPCPIIKLATEVGEYRGTNFTFEIGVPVIVGIGIMLYM